jgi:hypothetical protein
MQINMSYDRIYFYCHSRTQTNAQTELLFNSVCSEPPEYPRQWQISEQFIKFRKFKLLVMIFLAFYSRD